jgi:hypothetical protein
MFLYSRRYITTFSPVTGSTGLCSSWNQGKMGMAATAVPSPADTSSGKNAANIQGIARIAQTRITILFKRFNVKDIASITYTGHRFVPGQR